MFMFKSDHYHTTFLDEYVMIVHVVTGWFSLHMVFIYLLETEASFCSPYKVENIYNSFCFSYKLI